MMEPHPLKSSLPSLIHAPEGLRNFPMIVSRSMIPVVFLALSVTVLSMGGCSSARTQKEGAAAAASSAGTAAETQSVDPVLLDQAGDFPTRIELSQSSPVNGSIVRVQVFGVVPQHWELHWGGQRLALYPRALRSGGSVAEAMLGIPYDQAPGSTSLELKKTVGNPAARVVAKILVRAGEYRSEVLKVLDPSKVKPQKKKDIDRIVKEMAKIAAVYANESKTTLWTGAFHWPIQSPMTSPYGVRRLYNGKQKSFHPGLDLKAPVGTPIVAPAVGKVVMADDLFFTGHTLFIDHGFGFFSLYAHMSRIDVKVGQEVKVGDPLGLSGMTGRVTGPHLHWQIVLHHQKVNPKDLVELAERNEGASIPFERVLQ